MKASLVVAQKEFMDGLRNRWLIAITLIFAVFASALSWFGSAAVGSIGFGSVANTIISLSSLNIFLLPLIALLLSYNAIVGEDEDGTLLLLLTYPLTKFEFLIGKLLGHAAILTIATIVGFGSASVTIAIFAENVDVAELVRAFTLFIFSSVLLGLIFISLAYWISSWVSEKSKAAGLALIMWFFFVLIFDMVLLGMLITTEGQLKAELFPYLLLMNPTDIFRLVNLVSFEAKGAGLLSIASDNLFSVYELIAVMLVWIIILFSLAYHRLLKRPI